MARATGSVEKPVAGAWVATLSKGTGDSSRDMATMRGGGLQEFRVELQALAWEGLACKMDSKSSAAHKNFKSPETWWGSHISQISGPAQLETSAAVRASIKKLSRGQGASRRL